MKLEIARGLFVLGALALTSVAMAAWQEPRSEVLSAVHGEGVCALPKGPRVETVQRPDQDLLLFMFGLAQGKKSAG
jgi:hypothetical protein